MIRGLALAALVAFAPACSRKPPCAAYSKGPPRHVAVDKTATDPEPVFRSFATDSTLVLIAARQSDVAVDRQVTRSTYAMEGRGSWKLEWLESLAGLFAWVAWPAFAGTDINRQAGPDTLRRCDNPISPLLDPRRTFIGMTYTGRILDEDLFPDDPTVRHYAISLPMPRQEIRYRVLSIARAVLAEGRATTTAFGEIELHDVPHLAHAVAVEVELDATRYVVLVERDIQYQLKPRSPTNAVQATVRGLEAAVSHR